MKRRQFVTLIGGAVAWPLAARAQQPAMPVIGFLNSTSPDGFTERLRKFSQGLKEQGFVEGENVAIEYRWADQFDRLADLAAELVRKRVPVIITPSTPATIAAKAATTTIPIVFATGYDPVASGLVASLARPGGNATGIYFLIAALEGKRVEFLHEVVPKAGTIALLVDPNFPSAATMGANAADDPLLRYPITGIAGCCACATSGHVAAPPSSVMNSRRFIIR